MGNELVLAAFLTAVGLCVAASSTYLYQGFAKQQAMLRYDGASYLGTLGNLAMSFVCGPFIILQMGWRNEQGNTLTLTPALVSALIAFGWAFITGLMFVGAYLAMLDLI